jgi:hypothetical protein
MKYLVMINVPGQLPYQHETWKTEDWAANTAFQRRFAAELKASGELVGVHTLQSPDKATRVRAVTGGVPITDGVFPEAKEFLAGYWIVDVKSPGRAYEIAALASAAPGPGGKPLNLDIEVREVLPDRCDD